MMDRTEKVTLKLFAHNVLQGLAIGIVAGLVPSALLSELSRALMGQFPIFSTVLQVVTLLTYTLPLLVGAVAAQQFKMTPVQMVSVAAATYIGSGVLKFTPAGVTVAGIGDLVNVLITVSLAVAVALLIGDRLKAFTVLLLPAIVCLIAGGIGLLILPEVHIVTVAIGQLVHSYFVLAPLLMGILIALSFSLIILSPVSTVAIATAISMSGVASGTANLGVVAAAVGMFIGGIRVNPIGLSLSALLGSPKIMIAAVVRKPMILAPIALNAILLGIVGIVFQIKGTPISAGFGFSGLVGPINAIRFMHGGATATNLLIIVFVFIALPFVAGFFFEWFCRRILHLYQAEDYNAES